MRLPAQLSYFVETTTSRRNLRLLARFLAILLLMIAVYSVLFQVLMEYEGQEHSWLTGLYWTLTVMSTLGFGDMAPRMVSSASARSSGWMCSLKRSNVTSPWLGSRP